MFFSEKEKGLNNNYRRSAGGGSFKEDYTVHEKKNHFLMQMRLNPITLNLLAKQRQGDLKPIVKAFSHFYTTLHVLVQFLFHNVL